MEGGQEGALRHKWVDVVKVKAHRDRRHISEEEQPVWAGNEAADGWAKRASDDRNEQWGDAVEKLLCSNLHKARRVVRWLAAGSWPDPRSLGKHARAVERADRDMAQTRRRHQWVWTGRSWRCSECGRRCTKAKGGEHMPKASCQGRFDMSGIHASHKVHRALAPEGTKILLCVQCGGARTCATAGLTKRCRDMAGAGAEARLRRIRDGRHPYPRYKYPLHVLGPGIKDVWTQEVIDQSATDMSMRVGQVLEGTSDREDLGVDIGHLCEDVDSGWAGILGEPGEDGGSQDIEWALH